MTRTKLASVWPVTADIAAAAGHEPKSPMKAIRQKCLDCSTNQHSEVQRCEAIKCVLWPFRSGKHPYTAAARKRALHEHDFQESDPIHEEVDQ